MRRSLTLLAILVAITTFAQLAYSYDSLTHTQTWKLRNGKPAIIYQWRDTGRAQDRHVIKYNWAGYKVEEYSERYGLKYDSLFQWTEEGKLIHVAIYSDTGYLSIDYNDTTGQIVRRGQYRLIGMAQNPIDINDTLNRIRYYPVRCEYGCYIPTGIWHTFDRNGKLESIGAYLPYNFLAQQQEEFVLDHEENCLPVGTVLHYSTVTETFLRDETWTYFDETGKKIREEYYEGGFLRNTIQH